MLLIYAVFFSIKKNIVYGNRSNCNNNKIGFKQLKSVREESAHNSTEWTTANEQTEWENKFVLYI